MRSRPCQHRIGRKPPRGQGPWLLLAGVLLLTLGGCSSGDLTAPDDVRASWDSLEYRSTVADTLSINGRGEILFRGAETGADTGLLGADMWRSLETALASAELEPLPDVSPMTHRGVISVTADGVQAGFTWTSIEELTEDQRLLVGLLEELRAEALGPDEDERVYPIPSERILRGLDARATQPAQMVIRDSDMLLELLGDQLDRPGVVIPQVDFSREMVIAVFLGQRSHEWFDVRIDPTANMTASGYLQIAVTQFVRAPECPVPDAEGAPFDMVRTRKVEGEVFFLWDRVVTGCTE